jgi:hypothetical protein
MMKMSLIAGEIGEEVILRRAAKLGRNLPVRRRNEMRKDRALALFAALLAAAPAVARTKIEIKETCGRPTVEYTIQAGDHPGYAFRIQQTDCVTEGAVAIAGVEIKSHKATGFTEMDEGKGRHRWFHVFTLANGDRLYARSEGTVEYQGRRFTSSTSNWQFVGGTGKFEMLKGSGTYACHPGPSGFACEAEGEYSLPTP